MVPRSNSPNFSVTNRQAALFSQVGFKQPTYPAPLGTSDLMSEFPRIPPATLTNPFYAGSVQQLHAVPGDDSVMVMRTTNAGSVFDVGAIFEIPGNDLARAIFRHVLYTKLGQPEVWQRVAGAIRADTGLADTYREALLAGVMDDLTTRGARTHHVGMLDGETGELCRESLPATPSTCNVVRRYRIEKPVRLDFLGAHLYDYSAFPHLDGNVVPLEVIVRFGITSGSSVYRKYLAMNESARKGFERELGVSRPLEAWNILERPIIDFTSKYEPEDRMVSKQEAGVMSGLVGAQFRRIGQLAVLGGWVVRHLLEEIGLLLWDLKWEFAHDGDDLVYVDTIDTDSIRATSFIDRSGERFIIHYNKQSMRDYFRLLHGDWLAGIDDAKARAKTEGVAFTELLKAGQTAGTYPGTPQVSAEFIALQVRKMNLVSAHMLGQAEPEATRSALIEAGLAEVEFYAAAGKLDDFRKLNGIS